MASLFTHTHRSGRILSASQLPFFQLCPPRDYGILTTIDIEAEKIRLTREITKIEQEVVRSEAKLSNESFVARAPAEVVEQENARLNEWRGTLVQLREMLEGLG